ncbi:Ig-like domain-containing protein [Seonamhaeicola aphaedonensis]|uniref:Ig-like domain-containing protein n=1 Tax=Seonamhaeicola aphaedonensis TaxID=1461338 RepID=A0A3D9HMS9_9FLAO|nr:Ig-like domain-containing protein [Seonamhaeicola aphaedonensis]RED50621.1 Ig-like domain-containing protein [Seonamhaeicola aphaedonensis]
MAKKLSKFISILFLCFALVNCANKGTPEGGPKDEDPPVIVKESPQNYTTNFNAKEIEITFNEFVKIKDLQKQLIISPPMDYKPEVKPLSGASKKITIKIMDTLQPNTTYAFNFGNSITDNNEGNPYPYYRYVFSTGSYIDSLTVNGNIIDAYNKKPETFVNVALYEVDSTFTDSIIYKEVPKYITNTLDSLTTFSIENIKAGKYMLMALKDNNGDNKFQQKTDQIAFHETFITVPTDSLYTLKLFREELDFKAVKPKMESGEKITFGYEGDHKNMKIDVLSEVPEDFAHRIIKDETTDTLYYWYKPKLEVDSLVFKISNIGYEKEYTPRMRPQERDSLTFSAANSGNVGLQESFKIRASTPIISLDTSKVSLMDKDSVNVEFKTKFDTINNTYVFDFKKSYANKYDFNIEPEAFTDFYEDKNIDTLQYSVRTKKEADYGFVRLTLVGAKYPVIIQLTDSKGDVKYEKYATKPEQIDFLDINPGKYDIRVIHDANGNKKYDTGSYLKKVQPEKVSHFIFDNDEQVRASWEHIQTLNFLSE